MFVKYNRLKFFCVCVCVCVGAWVCVCVCVCVFGFFFPPLNQAARVRGVDCMVAPYEADAQLAYLTKSGLAQAVITEDSDLLAFGCKKVLDQYIIHIYTYLSIHAHTHLFPSNIALR